jgi:hypothetical protein
VSKKTVKTTTSPRGTRALVLASTSPYRKALLERLGLPFTVAAPAIDESARLDEAPADTAVRLAEAKARAVASAHPDALIVGPTRSPISRARPSATRAILRCSGAASRHAGADDRFSHRPGALDARSGLPPRTGRRRQHVPTA